MDLKHFSHNDSVLLIGEGNFSFAVGLEKLKLPIKITATCFEPQESVVDADVKYHNIEHLRSKGVRVLLGVDGTELTKHSVLGSENFSKIIFNFPHVGGKMKIHLNRKLLRAFFLSASMLLEPDGMIIVSLCKGQGGTPADAPMRRWDDTWQVVEMAAHANMILSSVERFQEHLVPNYSNVGYRSRDTAFHADGALVHIFVKVDPLYSNPSLSSLMQCLEPQILETNFGKITCTNIYVTYYHCNPILRKDSPVHYLSNILKAFIAEKLNHSHIAQTKYIEDSEVPLHLESIQGDFHCVMGKQQVRCNLRPSLLAVSDHVLPHWLHRSRDVVIFSGVVFNKLSSDFTIPPLANHMMIVGNDIHNIIPNFITHIITLVKDCDYECSVQKMVENCAVVGLSSKDCGDFQVELLHNVVLLKTNVSCRDEVIVGQEYFLTLNENGQTTKVPVCLIYVDKLIHFIFKLENWRQLWVRKTIVKADDKLSIISPSLYPRSYTFDICFASETDFECQLFIEILWQVAGDMITSVKLLNQYVSASGWTSKCYRIVYQSFDKALCRVKAVSIHQDIIGKIVCEKLGVSVH